MTGVNNSVTKGCGMCYPVSVAPLASVAQWLGHQLMAWGGGGGGGVGGGRVYFSTSSSPEHVFKGPLGMFEATTLLSLTNI